MPSAGHVRTSRQRGGDRSEATAARAVAALGWSVLGRNVVIGRDEVDLVALDPGPPRCLVFVEVRSNVTSRFGAPEESVAGRKIRRTYRAALALIHAGMLPNGLVLPRVLWRVDLIAVEGGPSLSREAGGPLIRHLRAVALD